MTSWTVAQPARDALHRVRDYLETSGRDKVAPWVDEVLGSGAAGFRAPSPGSVSSTYSTSPPPPYSFPTFGSPSVAYDHVKSPFGTSNTSPSGSHSFGSSSLSMSSLDDPFNPFAAPMSATSAYGAAAPSSSAFGGPYGGADLSAMASSSMYGALPPSMPSYYGGANDYLGRASTAMYWCAAFPSSTSL